jgi:dTDP-4-dehydrorhamnose reductase
MKVLITGGRGMVGKHLQEILPNASYIGREDCDLTLWKEVEYMMFL